MPKQPTLLLPILLAALLLGGACAEQGGQAGGGGQAGAGQQVTVTATEFKFDPATVTVRVNEPVRVTLRNSGTVVHDWTVQGLDQDVSIVAQPRQSASGDFTTTKTGTYKVICKQPGHEGSGMVGELVVQ